MYILANISYFTSMNAADKYNKRKQAFRKRKCQCKIVYTEERM